MTDSEGFRCLEKLPPRVAERLGTLSASSVTCRSDRALSISSKCIRGLIGNDAFVALSESAGPDDQVKGLLDALHWQRHRSPEGRARYFIPLSDKTEQVLQALASLNDALAHEHRVAIAVDGEDVEPELPDFTDVKAEWREQLADRDRRLADPPPLVRDLEAKIDHPEFRWHLSVTTPHWSGRLGGLRVCQIDLLGNHGSVSVGKAGSTHPAADRFRRLSKEPLDFDSSSMEQAAHLVRSLAELRAASGDPEHHMEDQILRSPRPFRGPHGEDLEPALGVSQFPALWSQKGKSRYTDLLMRNGDVPWILELKVKTQGQGQYYRHAVGQVVLYRAFVRNARKLWPWFYQRDRPMDPSKCEGAVVFPTPHGPAAGALLDHVMYLADLFSVHVLPVSGFDTA